MVSVYYPINKFDITEKILEGYAYTLKIHLYIISYLGTVAFRGLTVAVHIYLDYLLFCFLKLQFHSMMGVTHYFVIKNIHTFQYMFMKNVTYTEFRTIYGFRQFLLCALCLMWQSHIVIFPYYHHRHLCKVLVCRKVSFLLFGCVFYFSFTSSCRLFDL